MKQPSQRKLWSWQRLERIVSAISLVARSVSNTRGFQEHCGKRCRSITFGQHPGPVLSSLQNGFARQRVIAKFYSSNIARQIGISRWYAGRIREGYRPHPRHWERLAECKLIFWEQRKGQTAAFPSLHMKREFHETVSLWVGRVDVIRFSRTHNFKLG